ncbi:nuclear mitotic apparatus protein 1 isoform X2 [Apteryx mantelli]|uniref:Nuclear mitotic apparatus protein 1 isoform X2 n=1 Tax=Apteryx mantelli TaxID=2696672 RepID=A0ABM4F904_9AVES
MPLHAARAAALLAWVNSTEVCTDPLDDLSQLQDCGVFIKIINKIHRTEEGESLLEQPLPERIAFVRGFLQKHCKHKSTTENLVSAQKLLEAEELELAKVAVLLLYHTSMSSKSPRDWNAFDYKIQVELATILKFVLDNEESLNENLEAFLQRKVPLPSSGTSSTSSEEHSPVFSHPQKREVRFLELQKIASSSGVNNMLPGAPSSPVGDVMQTPQFQLRRLKKQLAVERENRDELEMELAENRKLVTEKEAQITVMQQRIDRLTLLNERQAADQLEPKEVEELREKNEGLMMRLHEALKQCQDLKTEKGQMDRKINQLSEENGDLSFKLREIASHLVQLQEALNELSEEHNAALTQSQEKQTQLESELRTALQEKKCLEEKIEILQGKISLLEDQLAKLRDCNTQEKGEVMGDVLKLEELKQEVSSLTAKVIELQATVLRLEEEKSLREANLQSERSRFEEEKLQLSGLIASLQSSVSEIHLAKEKLEQDLRAQEARLTAQVNTLTAEIGKLNGFLLQKEQELVTLQQQVEEERAQKGRLTEDLHNQEQASRETIKGLSLQVDQLSSTLKHSEEKLVQVTQEMEATCEGEARQLAAVRAEHEKAVQERDSALQQLQRFQQVNEAELAALSSQLQTLEKARDASQAASVQMQKEKAELNQKVQELEARILELTAQCQQSTAQAGMAETLKTQLRDLENKLKESQQKLADKEKLAKENSRLQERLLFLEESVRNTEGILEDEKRRASESLEGNLARISELESEKQQLMQRRDQALQEKGKEQAKRQTLEMQLQQLGEEYREKTKVLQSQLAEAAKGEEGERGKLEEQVRVLSRDHTQTCQRLQAEQEKVAGLEARLKRLATEHQERLAVLQTDLSSAQAQAKEKEGKEQKLRAEVSSLQEKIATSDQAAAKCRAQLEADVRKATEMLKGVSKELSDEKLKSKELEAAVKRLGEQESERLTSVEADLSRTASVVRERELEVERLSGEVTLLSARLEETLQKHKQDLAHRDEEAKCLRKEVEQAKADCAAEKARKAELEVQLQNSINEQRVERSVHQEELARSLELIEEKEGELDELRLKNVSRGEELRDLQKTVSKLKGELASVEAVKERASKMDNELQGFLEAARTQDVEIDSIKAVYSKEMSLKSLEKLRHRQQESSSSQDLYQEKLKEAQMLNLQVEKLEQKCREQQDTIAVLEKAAAGAKATEHQQAELEALRKEAAQQKEKASELQKLLEASRSAQALQDGTVETLKKELQDKGKELIQSKNAIAAAEKELASLRSSAQEKGRSEESWKEQVAQCIQEMERKNSLIGSLEHEVSILHRQVTEKEGESKELKRLIVAESEKSKKLEERLRMLQTEMATAASRAAERCSLMKVEVQRCQEEMEKQRLTIEALKRERHCQSEREEELRQEVKVCQDKYFQKEQLLSSLQQELGNAQALAGELMPLKHLYQQLQAERASLESKHRDDLEQRVKAISALQAELARAKLETAELPALREKSSEQDRAMQRLQKENADYAERLAGLQQANARLSEENRGLSETSSRGQQRFDAELSQAREKHARELERLRLESEKLVAGSRQEAAEAAKKLEAMSNKYENTKVKVLEERQKFQEERQKLVTQVEELNKKLSQHEKATRAQQQRVKALEGELQTEATRQQEKVAELQEQLAQKEQAAEHYKAQMEKAKTHYDAKKQQNQDLAEKLKAMEQLQKENAELKAESEKLAKELQQSILQAKESELSCRNLTSQVRSLEAQVEFADRQLRELGKFQVATDTLKGRETFRQNPADLSTDSLELSIDETQPLNSTRKPSRSRSEASAGPGSAESPASRRLPRKVESLESLYFTPIPSRTRAKLESSGGSLGDLSLDSGCKTRSARRRTTQIINITMTKKQAKVEEPDSADASFCSIPSAQPPKAAPGKGRLRSAASARSLASFPSQESLVKPETSSPEETTPGNSALLNLPGYRPTTRSSLRRSLAGSSSSLGRSSVYLSACQDEPEQLDDWNRIAELQQRNRACPPHLKTCYPLESRPSNSLGTITDEEMKTGDPKETLRRASMQPSQIAESAAARRATLGASWAGITTRQQRKRLSDESHQGPDTPESKKSLSCFPRPQTPRERSERRSSQVSRRSEQQAVSKQAERRQSMAFSILNTPKKLGSSLLRRAAARKTAPKNSPRGSTRRSPRIATAKSPKGKATRRSLKDTKF